MGVKARERRKEGGRKEGREGGRKEGEKGEKEGKRKGGVGVYVCTVCV